MEINNYSDFMVALTNGDPFAFTRYGDGEFSSMFKFHGENCDGHEYFEEMGELLVNTLSSPHDKDSGYHYGLVRIAQIVFGEKLIDEWCKHSNIDVSWENGTVLKDAAVLGKLFPFVSYLRESRVLYVGPEYYAGNRFKARLFTPENIIFVPERNAFLRITDTIGNIRTYLDKNHNDIDVVCFSAGPMTEIIIHNLWPSFGEDVKMIDVGSVFDGFIGVRNRSYNKKRDWNDLAARNLFGDVEQ